MFTQPPAISSQAAAAIAAAQGQAPQAPEAAPTEPSKAQLLASIIEWLQQLGAPASVIGVVVAELTPYL